MRAFVAILLGYSALLPCVAIAEPVSGGSAAASSPGNVVHLWIKGNASLSHETILRRIQSRPGTPFDLEVLCNDVRRLDRTHQFSSIQTLHKEAPGGRIVWFVVSERPQLQEVEFVGCHYFRKKTLAKEVGLKVGDPADPELIEEARSKLESFYHKRGFSNARITLFESDKQEDKRAVFVIDEGKTVARATETIHK
jgi:outer membrane protein insertion porin family